MRRLTLPQPPNASDPRYGGSTGPMNFIQDVSTWLTKVKGLFEDASRDNDRPMGQQFVVNSFTTNTVVDGTTTGTDMANYVSSLTQAMIAKGLVSQTISRTGG